MASLVRSDWGRQRPIGPFQAGLARSGELPRCAQAANRRRRSHTAPGSWRLQRGVSIPEIDGRIDSLKRNLDTLLQRYTEQHPDVANTRRLIKELEEQKTQEAATRKKAAASNPASAVSNNPVYQQLKISLAEAEANVASLRTRVAEYEGRYKHLVERMKTMPEIEAEYAALNRDYDVQKKNYDALLARRESASMTGDLESVAGLADFRLIDPPTVSKTPVAPNRMLLLPIGLIAALGAGIAAAVLMSQLRPVFVDGKSLRETTGLPCWARSRWSPMRIWPSVTSKGCDASSPGWSPCLPVTERALLRSFFWRHAEADSWI